MAFGIGTNTQKADSGIINGKQREIACLCGFTSKGKITPLMLKVQDEDGEIRTVHQIKVLSQEEKVYAGVSSLEFDCIITILEQQINVHLIYYKEENRWVLVSYW
ncbi:MAG: hypothetical protein J1E98_14030 [Lachnospiraceae bacterium]|nr:hypothetical protein [Lachnospiraceae bacterium]